MLFKVRYLVAIMALFALVDAGRIIRSPGNRGWGSFDSNPTTNARVSPVHGSLARSSSWEGATGAGVRSFGNGYGAASSFGSGWDTGSLGRSNNAGCNSEW
ncbi:PREDICTED: uncharacterized protein LOC106124964 [Papilio xuthus]|uniref:Uncharacterized protein LOC106124964 n=1 Tax=Papilio xuthus TaxID=66420 RepID=A0AAJ6ZR31_PAPXU|nr:PREDICTED: uncharacterized protein LOC106124964 [Papilio xuthus]